MKDTQGTQQKSNARLAMKLAGVSVVFAGLGFGMVPLYDAICRITGLNGRTNTVAAEMPSNSQIDTNRWVTVEFLSHRMPGVGLMFKPEQFSMRVHPGQVIHTSYTVHNETNQTFVGQAVPSVTPAVASPFLQKIECFCFSQQSFTANETRTLPVVFFVDPDLDANMGTITLSYTFFEAPKPQASSDPQEQHKTLTSRSPT